MKKAKVTISSKTTAIIIAVFGIVVYLLSFLISNDATGFSMIFKKFLEIIGSTLLSAGCVSFILELSTIKNCVESAIQNVITGDLLMEEWHTDVVKKVKEKSTDALCDGKDRNNTVYKLEPHLFNQIGKPFYESHDCKFILSPDPFNKNIKKDISLNCVARNDEKSKFDFRFSTSFKKNEQFASDNVQEFVRIKKFIVNGSDLTLDATKRLEFNRSENQFEEYPLNVSFVWDLSTYENVILQMEYEYTVDWDDLSQVFKLMHPCKKLTHSILVEGPHSNTLGLSAYAFSAFSAYGNPLAKNYSTAIKSSNDCEVNFNEWALPGSGYVVNFVKK